MSRENPLWDAPCVHGELLKLGIDIGQTSVAKYMVKTSKTSVSGSKKRSQLIENTLEL